MHLRWSEWRLDTSAVVAGGRGVRTYRRACPAANGLSRISRGFLESLDGARCWSRFDALLSEIEWRGHQRYPSST
jgi:hypothetical protein